LNESIVAQGGEGVPQDWAFLAMAHYRRGNHEEARRRLDQLRSYEPKNPPAFSWNDDVEPGIVLREAEAVIYPGRLDAVSPAESFARDR
jgi:hypothetical protein